MKLALAILFSAAQLHAAPWYVDNAASGANDGTSWENAWQSFADVVWGVGGVVAGDTLNISGGSMSKTYTEKWTVGASGTSGNPITIRVGQDAGHNGCVIFDYDADGDTGTGAAITCGRSYVEFDGSVGGVSHWVIANLRNPSDRTVANAIYSSISVPGSIGLKARWLTITNCNNGINWRRQSGSVVEDCYISCRGDAPIALLQDTTEDFDSSLVQRNQLFMLVNSTSGFGPDGIQCNKSTTMVSNTFTVVSTELATSTQHTDSIQLAGDFCKVIANTFINIGDSCVDVSYDYTGDGSYNDIWIVNNVMEIRDVIDPFPEFIRLYAGGCSNLSNIKIWNNTFANNTTYLPIRFGASLDPASTTSGCEIKNNIFYNCGNGSSFPIISIQASSGWTAGDFEIQTNIFYRATGTQYLSVDGTLTTTTDWVAANGGSTSSPTFVDAGAGDFHLSEADTVARGQGVNLSAFFTTDKDGVTRPSEDEWDAGPYQFAESAPPVLPSTWNIGTLNAVEARANGTP